jgi:hypothetical protein
MKHVAVSGPGPHEQNTSAGKMEQIPQINLSGGAHKLPPFGLFYL